MRIRPARRLRGRVERLPGDKSVSHRAAILAALARGGRSRLSNFATSADCASTLRCLAQLGVAVERAGADVLVRHPSRGDSDAFGLLRAPSDALDCGNSGSTMRMLAGLLAGQPFASVLTGDDSLRTRPMRRVIEPLELMGARLAADERGRAPLRVEGRRPLGALRYVMPVASAQVKSAVLLAGLFADGRTEVVERGVVTRDHTERMLRWFGVTVHEQDETSHGRGDEAGDERGDETRETTRGEGGDERAGASHAVSVEGGATFAAREVEVPGDVSSAAFLVAAAALLPGSELEIGGVGLNPTRTEFLSTMRRLGARVEERDVRERSNEPSGDLRVIGADSALSPRATNHDERPSSNEHDESASRNEHDERARSNEAASSTSGACASSLVAASSTPEANVLRGAAVARLIDELPMLAVVGTQVEGGLVIREASELRVKESDRISATVANLRAMGAEVEEYEDGLAVGGPVRLRGARLDARGDHRIAMAFAVAALVARGESEVVGAECVAVSFPEFFTLLESVTER